MTGLNFIKGECSLPTNPQKGRDGKCRINNVGHMSDEPTGYEKCLMHRPIQALYSSVKHCNLKRYLSEERTHRG